MSTDKKVYSGIDVCKLIAAVLVILLHTVETSAWIPCEIKYVFTRFAVPFFFVTSGFFFYKGLHSAVSPKDYYIRYVKNILLILFVWQFVLYLPFTIKTYVLKYSTDGLLTIMVVLIRRLFIIGSGPYWYLVALLYSSAFLYNLCFKKRNGIKILCGAVVLGLLLEIGYSCFRGVLSDVPAFDWIFKIIYTIWSWEYNFVTFGIPFMGIGYIIAVKDIPWKQSFSISVFIIATLFRIVEYNLPLMIPSSFWESNSISFAFIPQAIAFFMMGKNAKIQLPKDTSLNLRQLSSSIYYTHAIFLYEFLNPFMDRYTNLDTYGGVMIFPKVIIVLMLCCGFFAIIKGINNKYLNVLING